MAGVITDVTPPFQSRSSKGEVTNLWWEAAKTDIPQMVFNTVKYLYHGQVSRRAADLHYLRVYSNRLARSLSGSAFTAGHESGERIKMNVTKSAVDAAVAQIGTNQPRPMHLTVKGDYDMRKRAERLDRYDVGWFYDMQLYIVALAVFLDACISGTGILKFLARRDGRVGVERVRSEEIFVDDNECRVLVPGVTPRYLFHVRDVPKSTLVGLYPQLRDKIKRAEYFDRMYMIYRPMDELVTVVEAWKLPGAGKPGRHSICTDNALLLDEPWEFRDFPFAVMRWGDAPIGFWGIGAVEEILPLQIELNYLLQKVQRAMHFATSAVFKEKNSAMGKMTNEDWAVYEYTGQMPQFINMNSISGEFFAQIDRIKAAAYEIVGISQMTAAGVKPQGIYSAEGLRFYHDVASRRHAHIEKRYGQFFLDCAKQVEDRSREIVRRGYGTARVLARGDNEVEQLDWNDVKMEENCYMMQLHPVSIIPSQPAGKVELIKDLAQAVPGAGPYLMQAIAGIPDLEHAANRINAPLTYAERLVGNIIDHGRYEPPMPDADIATLRDVVQRELMTAEDNGLPARKIALLRRLSIDVDVMQAQMMMPASMPGAPMQGMPPGGGGPGAGGPQGMPQGMPGQSPFSQGVNPGLFGAPSGNLPS